jgi:hypothetical protein
MNIRDNKYKDFIYSSKNINKDYKKGYIISFNDNIINDPPYSIIKINSQIFTINNIKYNIPTVSKLLILTSINNNKIIYENNNIQYLNLYNEYLSKIEKTLIMLRNDIKNMNFYMYKLSNNLLDIISIILYEFKDSINFFNNIEYEKKLNIIYELYSNINNIIITKANYNDMINSRILNIVSISALPILVLMTSWGVNISKNDTLFNFKLTYLIYRITLLICILIIFFIFYIYRYDIFY